MECQSEGQELSRQSTCGEAAVNSSEGIVPHRYVLQCDR